MRVALVCSTKDIASVNMAEYIVSEYSFDEREPGVFAYGSGDMILHRAYELPWAYDGADSLGVDLVIFLSQHHSSEGIPALTTHSMGNWGDDNKFGGRPNELSAAAPVPMLSALRHLEKVETEAGKTYEATHHGPCLLTPSLFMEMGGSENVKADKELAGKVGSAAFEAACDIADGNIEYSKIAIGVGGGHYPSKFSALALGRGYAFSYIMPKYAMRRKDGAVNVSMLSQAIEKTGDPLDLIVMDWKGLDSETRKEVIELAREKGIDYERA